MEFTNDYWLVSLGLFVSVSYFLGVYFVMKKTSSDFVSGFKEYHKFFPELIDQNKMLHREIKEIEARHQSLVSQMEVRLTALISANYSEQVNANWMLREKLLLIEYKKERDPERRPPGRPRKNP